MNLSIETMAMIGEFITEIERQSPNLMILDQAAQLRETIAAEIDAQYPDESDDERDGEASSALASAGWGVNEDYGSEERL